MIKRIAASLLLLLLIMGPVQAKDVVKAGLSCKTIGMISATSNQQDLVSCLMNKKGISVWKSLVMPERPASPAGLIGYFAMPACPMGWVEARGQSTAPYPALASRVGVQIPDLRGYFLRAWDNGRGIDEQRMFASPQEDAIRNITASIQSTGTSGANGINFFRDGTGKGAFFATGKKIGRAARSYKGGNGQPELHFDASRMVPTAHENRPKNIALIACISTGE